MADEKADLCTRKPCKECPFARHVRPGTTGGSPPETFVGQAYGPFLLACHLPEEYHKDQWDEANLQCAGANIFRANVGRADKMPPAMLRCQPDTEAVFATPAELIAHHRETSVREAEERLMLIGVITLMRLELEDPKCRDMNAAKVNKK
jgi:hypothetical protein